MQETVPDSTDIRPKRQYQRISNERREMIIQKLNQGEDFFYVAEFFEVKLNTVRKIYKYKRTGAMQKDKPGKPHPKLNDIHKEQLCGWLDEDCSRTVKNLIKLLLMKWPSIESISETTIQRALKDFAFSFKRIALVPQRRNDPSTINLRYEYALKFTQMMVTPEKMFFIDEFGIQVCSKTKYGWAEMGSKAHKKTKAIRTQNYSVCAAMSKDYVFYFEVKDSAYNTTSYHQFLFEILNRFITNDIVGAYIIMDNVGFHHATDVKNLIEAHGHHAVYIPPYSPFLNPIEEVFSKWKALVRRSEPTNPTQLNANISTCCDQITPENCNNYFKHMASYIPDCIARKEILS